MRIVLWLSLGGILYTYVCYPVAMWMLARLRPRPWKAAPITPSVSIVLAVHNGAALLPRKIQHLLGLDYPNLKEIIIVSDGSTDGTADLLARQQYPRVKAIVLQDHAGKAVAVNIGTGEATAEVILFVDIRTEIAPGAIQELVSNFADPKVGCVCGNLTLRQGGHDATSAAVGGFYWRYEQWLRLCESISGSPVGVIWRLLRRSPRVGRAAAGRDHSRRHVSAALDHPSGLPVCHRPAGSCLRQLGQKRLKESSNAKCERWQETSSSSS